MTHATQDEEDAVGSLVKFELKKICSQRVTQVAVIVIAAFLALGDHVQYHIAVRP